VFELIRYTLWKRGANKAIAKKLTAECCLCDDPIVPGDFVGVGCDENNKPVLVHAGWHFTLKKRDAFCDTDAISTGIWDGHQVHSKGESLLAKVAETGQSQIG